MRYRHWFLMLILGSLVFALGAESTREDDLDRNRRLLDKWRNDPDHYQRLQRDLRAFYSLPKSQQQRLREFDHQIHAGDLTTQTRYWSVLERYCTWLEHQSGDTRQRIKEAPTIASRLAIIRELRMHEWLQRMPLKLKKHIEILPPDKQIIEVEKIREEERKIRQQWSKQYRPRDETMPARPTRLLEFPTEVQKFINQNLLPQLSKEEKEKLTITEGKWPDYPRTIRELSDAHPVLFPLPTGEIRTWKDLPPEVRKQVREADTSRFAELQNRSGNWPGFALGVTRLLEREGIKVPALGASRLEELPAEVQAFVKGRVLPILNGNQKESLRQAEGKWPGYQKQLLKVARDRRLAIPGMSLPGPVMFWENVRAALPHVPDRILRDFALNELTPEDRAAMQLSASDPMGSLEKLKKAFFKKKAADQDRKKREKKVILNGNL